MIQIPHFSTVTEKMDVQPYCYIDQISLYDGQSAGYNTTICKNLMQNFGSLTFEVMTVTPGKSKKSVKQNNKSQTTNKRGSTQSQPQINLDKFSVNESKSSKRQTLCLIKKPDIEQQLQTITFFEAPKLKQRPFTSFQIKTRQVRKLNTLYNLNDLGKTVNSKSTFKPKELNPPQKFDTIKNIKLFCSSQLEESNNLRQYITQFSRQQQRESTHKQEAQKQEEDEIQKQYTKFQTMFYQDTSGSQYFKCHSKQKSKSFSKKYSKQQVDKEISSTLKRYENVPLREKPQKKISSFVDFVKLKQLLVHSDERLEKRIDKMGDELEKIKGYQHMQHQVFIDSHQDRSRKIKKMIQDRMKYKSRQC